MPLTKSLTAQLKKCSYALFILWLGLVAPLVYFDPFAANHQVQPYHIALFAGRNRLHTLPTEATGSQLIQQLKQRLSRQQEAISGSSPFSSLVHSLQWSLGQPYLIAAVTGLLLLLFGRLSLLEHLSAVSAELPPRKKPPRLV